MSIRRRMFLGIALLFGLGFYFLITTVLDDMELRYRESTEEPLVDTARVLASFAVNSIKNNEFDIALFRNSFKTVHAQSFKAQVFGLTKTNVDLHIYITDHAGIVLFDSNNGLHEGDDYSQWRDVYRTLRGEYGARTSVNINDSENKIMYIASPIIKNGELIGVLSVGKPTVNVNQFTKTTQKKLIEVGFAFCLILIAIGLLLSLWVTRPIHLLINYARTVSAGKRVKRPKLGSGEMAELGQAFEDMRDTLEGRRYVENYVQTLTHEIKSPLFAIQGAAELLAGELTRDKRQDFINNIRVESDRISRIVEQLLLLSSLESRKHIENITAIDIDEILAEAIESLKHIIHAKKLRIDLKGERKCNAYGEAFLIRQVLANLLQNAIEFSPLKGEIIITVKQYDSKITVEIQDQGGGIPDYAKERIFERFYSLKRPDTGKKSSGLGLSLAREIMLLHEGTLSVSSTEQQGTVAQISLFIKTNKEH
ncbi:MAG: two-component system sensor histidine kinase CreC [Methylococcaceae bacterium]|nr:two-component system sensor histidine kinase CreC [Methylococcaceae bacterium]